MSTGPVCIVCDTCRADLEGSYPNAGAAYEVAIKAGWKLDWPEDPDGFSFYDGSLATCPQCLGGFGRKPSFIPPIPAERSTPKPS
jgi:hypothetical protein